MNKLATQVIDAYDDPLFDKEAAAFPDHVRGAQRLSSEDLANLHDRDFAVIVIDRNGVHRKWPVHDRAHIYMAAYYWGHSREAVPDLVRACAAFHILRAAEAWGAERQLPHRSEMEEICQKVSSPPSDNVINLAALGTRYSEMTRPQRNVARRNYQVTGDGSPLGKVAFALPASKQYPISSETLLKRAMEFFRQHERRITPSDRFEMAGNIIKNAEAFEVEVHPTIEKYASCDYRPDTAEMIRLRRRFSSLHGFPKEASSVYEALAQAAEDRAIKPDVCMHALDALDKRAGLDDRYGKTLTDPAGCFAAGDKRLCKEASFVAIVDGATVVESDLDCIMEKEAEVSQAFGQGVTDMLKNAHERCNIFREMPVDQQRTLLKIGGLEVELEKEAGAKTKAALGILGAAGFGAAGHEVGKRRYSRLEATGTRGTKGTGTVIASKPIMDEAKKRSAAQKGSGKLYLDEQSKKGRVLWHTPRKPSSAS